MLEAFQKFIEESNKENFLKLRVDYLKIPDLDPYSSDLDEIGKLMSDGEWEQAEALLKSTMMPNHFLSPGAHLNLGFVFHKQGKTEESQRESFVASLLMDGITSTGDGSEAHPFLVTRTSDEHDYLFIQDLTFKGQSLSTIGDRTVDVIETQEGTKIYFDVTDIHQKLAEKIDIMSLD